MDIEKEDILAKWLDGNLNGEQEAELGRQVDLAKLSDILQAQSQMELGQLSTAADMWSGLKTKMEKQSGANTSVTTNSVPNKARRTWLGMALALTLAAIAFYLYSTKQIVIQTDGAETHTQLLADNTEIILGPKSTLKYSSRNWSKQRSLELDGQAFFKVSKGDPFSVHTEQGIVTVLGTEFEIRVLASEMEVNCFEGRVSVEDDSRQKVILTAGEMVVIETMSIGKKGNISLTQPTFLQGESRYKGVAAQLILSELQRFYGVELMQDNIDLSDTFTGVIATNELDKACSTIATTFGWSYTIEGNRVRFSN